jgi:hypothetical protein
MLSAKAHEAKKVHLNTLTNGGEYKGWSPMTPKCTLILGVALVQKLRKFKALVGKANKHQIGPIQHNQKGLET